jgi:hypothetical protein
MTSYIALNKVKLGPVRYYVIISFLINLNGWGL